MSIVLEKFGVNVVNLSYRVFLGYGGSSASRAPMKKAPKREPMKKIRKE